MTREMCRLCLTESNLSPIFIDFVKSDRYSAVLGLTTGLKIEPNDGFSQQICDDCTESVNTCLRFRNKCHLSHIKLLQQNYSKETSPQNKNNHNEFCEMISKSENLDLKEDSNQEFDDGNGFPDFQIEVEFQRVTDSENGRSLGETILGGNSDKQDGGAREIRGENKKGNLKQNKYKMSRKERREMYLELVDGVLDPKGPVRCKVCKKTVSKWSCFISHAKLHLGFKFMCEFCGKSFISSTQLKRHCRSYHGLQRELACKHCNYLALDTAQLVLHERRLHTGERPYVCDVCGAGYHSRRCLLQHVEGHRTTATVQCEQCPLKFKSTRHLARHRYSAHARKRPRKRPNEALFRNKC